MRATTRPRAERMPQLGARFELPWCVSKCVTKCVIQLHTSTAARPRQHWVFAAPPGQTTRPPRMNSVGWVRVVWLGVFLVRVLAGAGYLGTGERVQSVIDGEGDGREKPQ